MCSDRGDKGEKIAREWVFLGLGSNLGERRLQVEKGIAALQEGGVIVLRRSSLYETEPVDFTKQPLFLNVVVAGETSLTPQELLNLCKQGEQAAGRRRKSVRFGPRVLDIDILLYKGQVIHEEDLEIPHPRMHKRRFVLIPLVEIVPDIEDPRDGRRFAEILIGLDEERKVSKLKGKEL